MAGKFKDLEELFDKRRDEQRSRTMFDRRLSSRIKEILAEHGAQD